MLSLSGAHVASLPAPASARGPPPGNHLANSLFPPLIALLLGLFAPNATAQTTDPLPVISVSSPGAAEDSGTLTFNVTLDRASATAVSVDYADSRRGTAQPGADYEALTAGTLTFAASETSKTVTVTLKDDGLIEPDETVGLRFSRPENASLKGGGVSLFVAGAITDDDRGHTILIRGAKGSESILSVQEGDKAVFHVEQEDFDLGLFDEDIVFTWSTIDGTATAGSDYTAVAKRRATLKAGARSVAIEVETLADAPSDSKETFQVQIDEVISPVGRTRLFRVPTKATATIHDGATLWILDAEKQTEGQTLVFPVIVGDESGTAELVRWRTEMHTGRNSAREVTDYTGADWTFLSFQPGESRANISVETLQDSVDEPDEAFSVVISVAGNSSLELVRARAIGVIRDDDPSPKVAIANASAAEGQKLTFNVTLDKASEKSVELGWATKAPASAAAAFGQDYTGAQSGKLSIAPGVTAATIEFTATDDDIDEPDETFELRLFDVAAGMVEMGDATGTILDNDLPTFSISGAPTAVEGDNVKLRFQLSLSRAQDTDAKVTVDGKNISAIKGQDFSLARTIQTFTPGQVAREIEVIVYNDEITEDTESFKVVLSDPSGARIAKGEATGTITDDDRLRVWIANTVLEVAEGEDIEVLVRRSSNSAGLQSFVVCPRSTGTGRGHASIEMPNRDLYVGGIGNNPDCLGTGFVSFSSSSLEESVTVNTDADDLFEGDETFRVSTASVGVDVRHESQIFTIVDDDVARLRVESVNSPWEGQQARFEIHVDDVDALQAASTPIHVTTSDGAAKAGEDYTKKTRAPVSLTKPSSAGTPVATFTVDTLDDEDREPDETFTVTLGGLPGHLALDRRRGVATATIRDDDSVLVSAADAVVDEGSAATVGIKLTGPLDKSATVTWSTAAGSAASPADFTAVTSGTVVIPAGDTAANVRVTTVQDTLREKSEDFKVIITKVDHPDAAIGRSGVVTIRDDDAALTVTGYSDASVDENGAWTSGVPPDPGTAARDIVWTLEGDDAADFTIDADTGQLTLPAQNFEVPADKDGDNVYKVTVRATDDDGATGAQAVAVTVTDVVHGYVNFTGDFGTEPLTVAEGESLDAAFKYAQKGGGGLGVIGKPEDVNIQWQLEFPSGVGHAASAQDVTLPGSKGAQSLHINHSYSGVSLVNITQDQIYEQEETFNITFSVDNDDVLFYNIDSKKVTNRIEVRITNDDTAGLTLSAAELTVAEADDASTADTEEHKASYTVKLETKPADDVTISLSAGADAPVTLDTASLTFTPDDWDKAQTVTVTAVDDNIDNASDKRTATVTHTADAGYGEATADLAVTITDNDSATLSVDDAEAAEGANATFTVTLSTPAARDVTVTATTATESDDTATANTDYTAKSQKLTIGAGDNSADFEVAILADTLHEIDETFTVTLTEPSGATIATATITGNAATLITPADATAKEGAPLRFTLTRAGDTTAVSSLTWTTTADTTADAKQATAGADYTAVSAAQTVTFAAAETEKTITVATVADNLVEGSETLRVNLADVSGATLANTYAIGTITEGTTGYAIANASASEGDSLTFTVTRSGDIAAPSTVNWTTGDDPTKDAQQATADTDYTAVDTAQTLTFTANAATGTITVTSIEDSLDEPDETFRVTLASPSSGGTLLTATATGTIKDEDAASATVSVANAAAVTEGDDPETTTDMTFRVTLSTTSGQTVTVPFTLGGSAKEDDDYTAPDSLTVTLAPGDTSADIIVPIKGDLLDEDNEIVTVTLAQPTNAALSATEGATEATGTITDNDAAPNAITLTVDADTAAAGPQTAVTENGGAKTVRVTATITSATRFDTREDLTVTVGKSTDTATEGPAEGADYAAVADLTLTLAAGASSGFVDFTLTPTNDNIDEDNESITIDGALAGVTFQAATVTITDNDSATLSVDDAEAAEGANATFTVTLSTPAARDVTVTATTATESDDTATANTDYTAKSQKLTIGAGDNSADFEVAILTDSLNELAETFTVTLSAPTGATLADATATGTITGNAATLITVADATAAEGAPLIFTLTRAGDTTGASALTYTTVADTTADAKQATAGADYTAVGAAQTLSFAAGDTEKTLRVATAADALVEGAETLRLALADVSGATLANTYAIGTITEGTTGYAIANASASEGDSLTFTVTRSGAVAGASTVTWTTGDDPAKGAKQATAGGDYTAVSAARTLSFAADDTSKTLTVATTEDTLDEPAETFVVTLASPSAGGALLTATAIGTITDDDAATSVLSIDTPTVTEGDNGTTTLAFTVMLSPASGRVVTMAYADSRSGTAASGIDYTALTAGTLTFNPGDTSKTIDVTVTGDTVDEPDETVVLRLSSATNAAFSSGQTTIAGTGSIEDDDPPTLSIGDATAAEGELATFSLRLSSAHDANVTVTATTADGTARSPSDYTHTTRTLTISAGDLGATFAVPTASDTLVEGDETFTVTLSDASVPVSDNTGEGKITDENAIVMLTVDADTRKNGNQTEVTEGDGASTTRVTATFADGTRFETDKTVRVTVGAAGDSAVRGDDYTAVRSVDVIIAARAASGSATFVLTPVDNYIYEPTEHLSLTATFDGVMVSDASIDIADNDVRGVKIAPTSLLLAEEDNPDTDVREDKAIYTIVLTSQPTGDVGISLIWYETDYANVDVSPYYLTFTPSNWDEPQEVTAMIEENLNVDDNNNRRTFSIRHRVKGAGTDYERVTAEWVQGTVTDDDLTPQVALSVDTDPNVKGAQTRLAEDGGAKQVRVTATFTGGTVFSQDKTVNVSVGQRADSAVEGVDYANVGGVNVAINALRTSGSTTFLLTPTDDAVDENDETISVIGSLSGVTVTPTAITLAGGDTPPELSIDAPKVTEGNNGSKNLRFTVILSAASGRQVTVAYADLGTGTARSGSDYSTLTPRSLNFAPGQTSKTIDVSVNGDYTDELDETIVLRLSSPVNATFAGGATLDATGTIEDNDGVPELSVDTPSVMEGDNGTTTLAFTVRRSKARAGAATVTYEDFGVGTATSSSDYAPLAKGSLTLAEGEITKTIDVTVNGDTADEPDETVVLRLSSPNNARLAGNQRTLLATGVIEDDDPPTLSIGDATASEGKSATFSLRLSSAHDADVTVTATTADGTAAAPGDYTHTTRTLTIPAGDLGATFAVPTTSDTLVEGDETFTVILSNASVLVSDMTGAGRITDGNALVMLTVDADTRKAGNQTEVPEDGRPRTVRVTATFADGTRFETNQLVRVTVGAADDSAVRGDDYTAIQSVDVVIPARAASGSATFSFTPRHDNRYEPTERVSLTSTFAGVMMSDASIAIADDDVRGMLFVPKRLTISEQDDPETKVIENLGVYGVLLTSMPTGNVRITMSPRFAGGGDVEVSPGSLTFTPSNWFSPQEVTLKMEGDMTSNPTDLGITIRHYVKAAGTDYEGVAAEDFIVTVSDSDKPPVGVVLSVDTDTTSPGNQTGLAEDGGAQIVHVTATFTGGSVFANPQDVIVSVGRGSGSAVEGTDYEPVTHTVLAPPSTTGAVRITIAGGRGSGSGTFTLTPKDDAVDEADETISVTGALDGFTVTPATLTITDNDAAPTLAIDNPSVAEGDNTAATLTFTVSLSPASGKTVTVSYADRLTGTATSGVDYTALTAGTLTFNPGDTSKTIGDLQPRRHQQDHRRHGDWRHHRRDRRDRGAAPVLRDQRHPHRRRCHSRRHRHDRRQRRRAHAGHRQSLSRRGRQHRRDPHLHREPLAGQRQDRHRQLRRPAHRHRDLRRRLHRPDRRHADLQPRRHQQDHRRHGDWRHHRRDRRDRGAAPVLRDQRHPHRRRCHPRRHRTIEAARSKTTTRLRWPSPMPRQLRARPPASPSPSPPPPAARSRSPPRPPAGPPTLPPPTPTTPSRARRSRSPPAPPPRTSRSRSSPTVSTSSPRPSPSR